jgi:hypothetical protein
MSVSAPVVMRCAVPSVGARTIATSDRPDECPNVMLSGAMLTAVDRPPPPVPVAPRSPSGCVRAEWPGALRPSPIEMCAIPRRRHPSLAPDAPGRTGLQNSRLRCGEGCRPMEPPARFRSASGSPIPSNGSTAADSRARARSWPGFAAPCSAPCPAERRRVADDAHALGGGARHACVMGMRAARVLARRRRGAHRGIRWYSNYATIPKVHPTCGGRGCISIMTPRVRCPTSAHRSPALHSSLRQWRYRLTAPS